MKRLLILSLTLLLGLSACNVPTEPSTSIAPELQTAAAQTVQAVLTPLNSPTAVPSATQGGQQPAASPTGATLTAAATITSTSTITPTYSVPMITFNESTNCRTGPGQNYEVIFTFLPGGKAEIVGSYPQDGYWIVQLPDGGGTCWAWAARASRSAWMACRESLASMDGFCWRRYLAACSAVASSASLSSLCWPSPTRLWMAWVASRALILDGV